MKDLPEGQTHSENDGCGDPAHNCFHDGLKHTERLMRIDGSGAPMLGMTQYVIETYCADCGQFLKQVEIKSNHGN